MIFFVVLIFDLDKVNIKNVYQRYNFVRIFQGQKSITPPRKALIVSELNSRNFLKGKLVRRARNFLRKKGIKNAKNFDKWI
jgi:hypothetical protein